MANNLQVNEGTSGKFVRTIDTGQGVHVPLDGLILDDGNGNWSTIQRRANAIRTSLENDEVGIAKENTLSSIDTAIGSQGDTAETDATESASLMAFIKGAVDQLVASKSTLADQTSYDRIVVNPATDSAFGTAYHAIRLASVDGDVEIKTGDGTNQVIPQAHLSAGQIIPLTVQQVVSGGTTQTVSDIMLLGN